MELCDNCDKKTKGDIYSIEVHGYRREKKTGNLKPCYSCTKRFCKRCMLGPQGLNKFLKLALLTLF